MATGPTYVTQPSVEVSIPDGGHLTVVGEPGRGAVVNRGQLKCSNDQQGSWLVTGFGSSSVSPPKKGSPFFPKGASKIRHRDGTNRLLFGSAFVSDLGELGGRIYIRCSGPILHMAGSTCLVWGLIYKSSLQAFSEGSFKERQRKEYFNSRNPVRLLCTGPIID